MITLVIRALGIGIFVSSTRVCAFSRKKMCSNVFVYGTLKRNQPNHHWLTKPGNGNSKFVSDGTTKTKYPLVVATKFNIPFLLQKPGSGHNVRGEIYEVDDKMLANLDVLEEHPNFYIREIDDIIVKGLKETYEVLCSTELLIEGKNPTSEATVKCWVYFQKKVRPELLDLQMVQDYSSTGAHGLVYVPVPEQDPTYNYKSQIRLFD